MGSPDSYAGSEEVTATEASKGKRVSGAMAPSDMDGRPTRTEENWGNSSEDASKSRFNPNSWLAVLLRSRERVRAVRTGQTFIRTPVEFTAYDLAVAPVSGPNTRRPSSSTHHGLAGFEPAAGKAGIM